VSLLLATAASLAIVALDNTALRAAPAGDAAQHAQLAAGDLLEVRGRRLDYLQVYDHRRERAGYVRASQVRAVALDEREAPQLLAVVRFLRDTPGAEALGIAYVAAYLKAAPAAAIGAEPFDALGVMAERLARRASAPNAAKATTAALETVAPYGVRFKSLQAGNGSLTLCYDGEAFARVLAHADAAGEARARAAMALTRADCIDPALPLRERSAHQRWRAETLDRIDEGTFAALAGPTKQRLRARRAAVWATLAFERSRAGDASPQAAAQRALDELAAIDRTELADDDRADYAEAAVRVGASRWAALPPLVPGARLAFDAQPGSEPGQTCVRLHDAKQPAATLARRCTFGSVWLGSARVAADGRTAVLAVQPLEAWTELWVFRARKPSAWHVDALPPAVASDAAAVGYIEFAGFVPGQPKLMVAREARVDGRVQRRFEVLRLDGDYAVERWASEPQRLVAFGRWSDAGWKQGSVALR
jgi:hypothetical protein